MHKVYPKIPRKLGYYTITEKLDGTNGLIIIEGDRFLVGSRHRLISPADDNFGFASWAISNKDELLKLGGGYHYGEWWGAGIGRRYGMAEKVFSLFDTQRPADTLPTCCRQVPLLWQGGLQDLDVSYWMESLKIGGSVAAPGFMDPEGIVICNVLTQERVKVTFDSIGKWARPTNPG